MPPPRRMPCLRAKASAPVFFFFFDTKAFTYHSSLFDIWFHAAISLIMPPLYFSFTLRRWSWYVRDTRLLRWDDMPRAARLLPFRYAASRCHADRADAAAVCHYAAFMFMIYSAAAINMIFWYCYAAFIAAALIADYAMLIRFLLWCWYADIVTPDVFAAFAFAVYALAASFPLRYITFLDDASISLITSLVDAFDARLLLLIFWCLLLLFSPFIYAERAMLVILLLLFRYDAFIDISPFLFAYAAMPPRCRFMMLSMFSSAAFSDSRFFTRGFFSMLAIRYVISRQALLPPSFSLSLRADIDCRWYAWCCRALMLRHAYAMLHAAFR